jgi:hypothetical protein
MNAETYLSQARRPDGSIRPLSEILESEHNARFAGRTAEILAEREAESKKSETQKRIEQHQAQYDDARRNDDHGRAKMYKTKLDLLKDQRASEQAAESRAKAFSADRRIALIREEAELIERSGAHLLPHASQLDRDNLVAIARNVSDFPDPQSQFLAFKELSDQLTQAEIESERIKASDARIESAPQGLSAAESDVRTAALEQLQARREGVADES